MQCPRCDSPVDFEPDGYSFLVIKDCDCELTPAELEGVWGEG